MANDIIRIPRNRFRKLAAEHPDYIGKAIIRHEHNGRICEAGDWCGFESVLTGDYSKGTRLVFEHIHFEIV